MTLSNRTIDEPRRLKVIYIGAGVSGILAAIEFPKALPSVELVIYEKNPELGGTWYENRYPGCACDIPSHAYQLSFESWTNWSQFYSGASEILEYWQRVADKYNIRKHIRFNHKCQQAEWDNSRSKWKVRLTSTESGQDVLVEDEGDVFITGTGLLNEWKWPDIENLLHFEGELLHTANWNENFDPTGKTVAVVGAGSSGIQVVPAIVSRVKKMDHYVRGRTWIATQLSEHILKIRNQQHRRDGQTNFNYTTAEIEAFKADRISYIEYRKALEFGLQAMYGNTQTDSKQNDKARTTFEANMRRRLASRPEIIDQMIPDYPPLCKRLTPGPGYLEALTASHVSLISQPIKRAYSNGLETSYGVRRSVDAIICATGFETSPESGFPIFGRNRVNLRVKQRHKPRTYLGLCTDDFPNFFQSLGPNSFQGAGSLLMSIEYIHQYLGQIINKLGTCNVKTIEPKRRQVDNFTKHCEEHFKKTVYTANCVSWYKRNGIVTALWPGSGVHALHALKSVRWEDYDMEYCDDDDFGWFGNGRMEAERDMNEDKKDLLIHYLGNSQYLHEPLRNGQRAMYI